MKKKESLNALPKPKPKPKPPLKLKTKPQLLQFKAEAKVTFQVKAEAKAISQVKAEAKATSQVKVEAKANTSSPGHARLVSQLHKSLHDRLVVGQLPPQRFRTAVEAVAGVRTRR